MSLAGLGDDLGWNEPWRGLLHELRRHPEAEVRDEALAVDMAAPKYFWTT